MGGVKLLSVLERKFVRTFVKRNTDIQIKRYFEHVLKNKDLIVFGGGQVADFKYTDCCKRIYDIVSIAEKYCIPVAFHAIGLAGDDYNSYRAQLFKRALNSDVVLSVSVRERIADLRNHLLTRETLPALQIADTAVWSSECYSVSRKEATDTPTVGINVISASVIDKFYRFSEGSFGIVDIYCKLYEEIKSLGYEVKFFINGVDRDNETINVIRDRLRLGKDCIAHFPWGSGKGFLKMLSQFSFVVSSRLHTSICCYSLRIPTVAFAWDRKFQEFYDNIGESGRCMQRGFSYESVIAICKDAMTSSYENTGYNSYRQTVWTEIDRILEKLE